MITRFPAKLPLLVIVGSLALVTACSGGGSSNKSRGAAALSSAIAAGVSGAEAASSASVAAPAAGVAVDPCAKLTKADVQPFFTVPIATALPAPINTATTKGCTWSAADGSAETSVSMLVRTGDDASQLWSTANSGNPIRFSGVGDQAEHISGISDFVSIKGGVVCSMTTFGRAHLAPLAGLPVDSQQLLSDADATSVAQQFGTLCNKIYGSGNTTATATATPPAGPPSDSASASPSASIPAAGSTLGNTKLPLPAGLDCTGKVVTSSDGTSCDLTIGSGDGPSIYAFYLSELPTAGFAINHEQSQPQSSGGGIIASILFTGNGFEGFCTIDIRGTDLDIDLAS
jgi:hypothetical protein